MQNEAVLCELCGEAMPPGETTFKYHGYSGPCPKPHIEKPKEPDWKWEYENLCKFATQYEEVRDECQAALAIMKSRASQFESTLLATIAERDEANEGLHEVRALVNANFENVVHDVRLIVEERDELKTELAKRDERIEKLRDGLKSYALEEGTGHMTHYWAKAILEADDKARGES